MVVENIPLGIHKDEVERIVIPAHSGGKRTDGTRVFRSFPIIPEWSGVLQVYVLDDIITKDVFERVVRECGQFNGIGRYRPQNGGVNGRFKVLKLEWSEMD